MNKIIAPKRLLLLSVAAALGNALGRITERHFSACLQGELTVLLSTHSPHANLCVLSTTQDWPLRTRKSGSYLNHLKHLNDSSHYLATTLLCAVCH